MKVILWKNIINNTDSPHVIASIIQLEYGIRYTHYTSETDQDMATVSKMACANSLQYYKQF